MNSCLDFIRKSPVTDGFPLFIHLFSAYPDSFGWSKTLPHEPDFVEGDPFPFSGYFQRHCNPCCKGMDFDRAEFGILLSILS